jgi:hypothetical protein
LSADQQAVVERLAAASRALPVEQTTVQDHDHASPSSFGPVEEVALTADEQALFDRQWAAAQTAASTLATPEAAAAAGYVRAASQLPGVGTHWVNWTLVDAPFDPAHPSMLLFDESPLHPSRLTGLSYWVHGPVPPEGFAGPNDVWHRHGGLCFVNGWDVKEGVASDACPGQWLDGRDLWMLHAWVVPGLPNLWGEFAPRNPGLCPPSWQTLPDVLQCPTGSGASVPAGSRDPVAVTSAADVDGAYCHLKAVVPGQVQRS